MNIDLSSPTSWFIFSASCFAFTWSRHNLVREVIKKVARIRGSLNGKVREKNKGGKTVSCEQFPMIFSFLYDTERTLSRIEFYAKWCWNALIGCSFAFFSVWIMALLKWVNLDDSIVVKVLGTGICVPFIFSLWGIVIVANWDNSTIEDLKKD